MSGEIMKSRYRLLMLPLLTSSLLFAGNSEQAKQKKPPPPAPPQTEQSSVSEQYSGMYSFLKEGEFVQLTVEQGQLSGFVSRLGDIDSDRGVFLDQFFDKAK